MIEFLKDIKSDIISGQNAQEKRLAASQATLREEIVAAQASQEVRLSQAQASQEVRLAQAQATLREEIVAAQASQEVRLSQAQASLKNDLVASQATLREDIKSDVKNTLSSFYWKLVFGMSSASVITVTLFQALGFTIDHPRFPKNLKLVPST